MWWTCTSVTSYPVWHRPDTPRLDGSGWCCMEELPFHPQWPYTIHPVSLPVVWWHQTEGRSLSPLTIYHRVNHQGLSARRQMPFEPPVTVEEFLRANVESNYLRIHPFLHVECPHLEEMLVDVFQKQMETQREQSTWQLISRWIACVLSASRRNIWGKHLDITLPGENVPSTAECSPW